MRLLRLVMAALAVMMGAAAGGCGDSTSMPADPSLNLGTGAYVLATVNGTAVPVEVRNDPNLRVVISGGSILLGVDGTFRQSFMLSETPTGSSASIRETVTQGTVTVRGTLIQFHASTGGEWEGTLNGNRIDYVVPGNSGAVAFSFQRG
ncbi:MAG TPA: hypothetical protein VFJ16_10225 [Longimicrobium sp.]|nr:hypothetical protein [Longimicrobium sp.]